MKPSLEITQGQSGAIVSVFFFCLQFFPQGKLLPLFFLFVFEEESGTNNLFEKINRCNNSSSLSLCRPLCSFHQSMGAVV